MDDPTWPMYRSPYDLVDIPPPPPPPKQQQKPRRKVTVIISVILVSTSCILGLFSLHMRETNDNKVNSSIVTKTSVSTQQAIQPTVTLMPTTPTGQTFSTPYPAAQSAIYTASDVVGDFQAAHLDPTNIRYGESIEQWTNGKFAAPEKFQSSAAWEDGSMHLGLWVYNTAEDAGNADLDFQTSVRVNGGIEGELTYGTNTYFNSRCLLIGVNTSSAYYQIMEEKCTY